MSSFWRRFSVNGVLRVVGREREQIDPRAALRTDEPDLVPGALGNPLLDPVERLRLDRQMISGGMVP